MNPRKTAIEIAKRFNSCDPFFIAYELGIIVRFEELGHTWGYSLTHRRISFIHINAEIDEAAQRFTCAHELGHLLLHKGLSLPFLKSHTLYSTNKYERQANTFAVELLVPDSLLEEYPECSAQRICAEAGIPYGLEPLKNKEMV